MCCRSNSVSANDFDWMLSWMRQIVETFETGPTQTQIGVVQFGGGVRTEFNLNTYLVSPLFA